MPQTRAALALRQEVETPAFILDLADVRAAYSEVRAALPAADCHYAIKANPHPDVLRTLHQLGCGFEVSSAAELRMVLDLGASPTDVISSNPIKTPDLVRLAHRVGMDRFAIDSVAEIDKLAALAPGSRVYVRLAVDNSASEWPLARKYGVDSATAVELLREARTRGLQPYGLTFHVGSQCFDAGSWVSSLKLCREIWGALDAEGIRLSMLNLGGGVPIWHTRPVPSVLEIGTAVRAALRDLFPPDVETSIEPGRALAGPAGTLVASVIGVAMRGDERWVYLDAGVFNAVFESSQGFTYEVVTDRPGPSAPCTLAGPSCDSVDVIADRIDLPMVRVGDRLIFEKAGAYTTVYASSFNGFPPPPVHVIDTERDATRPGAEATAAGVGVADR
jgi:ornithine decarboxylase